MGTKMRKIKSEAVNLEKEIERYLLGNADFLIKEGSKNVVQAIAHHFYELGCRRTAEKFDEIEYNRQRAEESIPNDLEDAAWDCVLDSVDVNNPVLLPKYKELLTYLFIAGAKWQAEQDEKEQADLFTIVALDAAQRAKEQMVKDAVEGQVFGATDVKALYEGKVYVVSNLVQDTDYNLYPNDKVRIIIVKE